ncbi:efflux RND transporter permease subunit [Nordella sp. HKS 07]|uniref:efflux RND transporter permease subunit n=1 Tax=Nordella sp. HKS 07 TaxID=2712222 RepID=UPI0013E10047|nr:efflux RND transporter permease subunit [Nordella sp. HKS 07]QIG47703.1 efflux RND transporter permease subunit [Nordella sp. HKS 07]
MMSNISAWAIRRPIPTILLFIVLTLMGWASFAKLPINADPNVSFPIVNVTVTRSGAAPAELETQVTRKIEGAVAGLAGVRHITSTIEDGVSTTTVEFRLEVDTNRATNDVRNAVANIRGDLPGDIDEPTVARLDIEGSAILYYVVQSPSMALRDLSWFVEDTIGRELLAVPGVQKAQRFGGIEREIKVELDPARLTAFGITADQVNSEIRSLNANMPGGRAELSGREQSVRTLGSALTVEAFADTQIPLPGGRWVKLATLGTVTDGAAEERSFARYDGQNVVGFSVSRAKGSSDTTVADAVAKKLEEIGQRYPSVKISELVSTVEYTRESYDAAMEALVEGAFLTVLVVFLFLRDWRATLIAALAMPLSMLPTFVAMDMLGFTLNSISLLALTLVIGILVDDAIVEIENIDRHIHMGKRPYLASIEAADAIGLAVVATTFTIVAVFTPVSFIGGIIGQYFKQFGITVAVAVLASLLVARLLTPLMAAYLLKPKASPTHQDGTKPSRLKSGYLRLLGWTLDHKLTSIATAIAIFIGSMFLTQLLPSGFLPVSDSNLSTIKFELAPGARLADTDRVALDLVAKLRERPEVAHVLATSSEVRKAELLVVLKPRAERDITRQQFEVAVRPLLQAVPDIRFTFQSDGGGGRNVSVVLAGDDPAKLTQAAHDLVAGMKGLPQVANVASTLPLPQPELLIRPRFDEAAQLGVSIEAIGTALRIATIGATDTGSAKFNLGDRQVPIRVALAREARADLDAIRSLRVTTAAGDAVPLSSVADIGFGTGEAAIERFDRKRRVNVEADLNNATIGEALAAIAELPAMKKLPQGVEEVKYGEAEFMQEMFMSFALAMATGIMMVFVVLILLFKDFLQPITILMALPLAIGGAMVGLLLYGAAFDLSAIIGLLMLMGIVTKNSILLVDFAIDGMERGMSRRDALLAAGATRARPIIMTTLAMIAGMLPAVLGLGAGASFRGPMAVAVIGGLVTSTLLSLVFVPVVFVYMDMLRQWLGRKLSRLTSVTEEDRKAGAVG